jgi:hypothetical protein
VVTVSGVLLVLAVAAVFGYLLYSMHERKKNDPTISYFIETSSLHVAVPSRIPKSEGQALAESLDQAHLDLWSELAEIYDVDVPHRIIGLVILMDGEVEPNHPYVSWHMSTNRMRLQINDEMVLWFALELHNVFRVSAFGYDSVYNFVSEEDREKSIEADQFIEDMYGDGHE